MKKRNFFIMIAALLGFCFDNAASVVTPGISRDLASERKATISNVIYNLKLDLDSLPSADVNGSIDIDFNFRPNDQPLQLDFTGKELKSLLVNGQEVADKDWREGHIVVAPALLLEGDNRISAGFIASDRALNRNPDYLYTLFVPNRAHSVFPCFDQPDIKASYRLTLSLPAEWKAVSNSPVEAESLADPSSGLKTIQFGPTEPLSTYLFAFAAGKFDYRQYSNNGRTIGAYHRENDPDRFAQLDEIFSQVENSLLRLEDYTGIPYPFAKYDLVILPGFQFGGMEHTGATFYNDNTIFLGKNATGADRLRRAMVISHETAHMWFGDYVTMEWFDDVWTKEVFANYFAAMLTRELLPEFDHDLEWLRTYMTPALDQDRSEGSTPIRQKLDNLKNAGLIYNNIIYNKSPLMMGKLAEITGEENFKKGIRKYLNDHAYGNATWDDVVAALSVFSEADLDDFSRVWVYEAGMPQISFDAEKSRLIVRQIDPRGRGIVWPQTFEVLVVGDGESEKVSVCFDGNSDTVDIPLNLSSEVSLIIPTADGRAYGLLTVNQRELERLMADFLQPDGIISTLAPVGKLSTLMMLNENYLAGKIPSKHWLDFLIDALAQTSDSQMLSALTSYVGPGLLDISADSAAEFENKFFNLAETHSQSQASTLILRTLIPAFRSDLTADKFLGIWQTGTSPLLSEDDFSEMALQLAIAMPDSADSIISTQRERISNPDRLRKFDYLSRAAVNDTQALDDLFESLRDPSNRLIEPWTRGVLALLNHHSRQDRSVKYIIPALEMLPEIQATGDIFFPAGWASSLLAGYRSADAAGLVKRFLQGNSEMNPLLLNKVLQAASRLFIVSSFHR